MLELGWSEIFVILVLAVLVVGPKELPVVMRAIGRVFRRLHYVKFALSKQFEDFMHEADIDDLRNAVNFEVKKREKERPDLHDPEFNESTFNESEADEDYLLETAHTEIHIETKVQGDGKSSPS